MGLYVVLSVLGVAWLLERTHGRFIYPLDDTYIAMAMSKNLARHGVAGLTPHEFTSASSCPLWMLLITAVYWVAGVSWWAPAALGLAAGICVLWVAYRILLADTGSTSLTGFALAALCVLTPLPALALSGMEHLLHIALVLWFAAIACRYLGRSSQFPTAELYGLMALMAVTVMVRYESLFLAAVFAGLAVLRRRWVAAAAVIMAASVPILMFGLFSVAHGWSWLPNSVLLKGAAPRLSSLGLRSLSMLFATPHLLGLAGLLAAVWAGKARRGTGFWEPSQLMLLLAMAVLLLHLQFASVGWFFRYEAYLVALGLMALACSRVDLAVQDMFSQPRKPLLAVAGLALLVAVWPLLRRAKDAEQGFAISAYNIFEQQYQMAAFMKQYYDGASIALNDVGAVNFLGDYRCLDLVGLCDRTVFSLRRQRQYNTQAMGTLASQSNIRIAAVYTNWFGTTVLPALPSDWIPVGSWRIPDNAFLGGDTVTFFAVQPQETDYLARSLASFAPMLPAGVVQTAITSR